MRLSEVRELIQLKPPEYNAVGRRLSACHDIADLRRVARRIVPRPVFDYVDGGSDEELSLRSNHAAFCQWKLVPRALAGDGSVTTSATVLGADCALPLALSPTGYSRMMHPAGEIAVARSAARHGLPYTLSTMGTTAIEDLRHALGAAELWFQLYVQRDPGLTKELVSRASESGYRVLMVTVDTVVTGYKIRDERNGLVIPPRITTRALADIAARPGYWVRMLRSPMISFANLAGRQAQPGVSFDPAINWETIDELRSAWPGALVLKGPLGPADARRAVEHGADGLVLSNHGGRQLDRTASPIDLLPSVRAELGPSVPLLVDSGVRHGTDIAVALALGADAAMIGRAYLYGLMAGGEPGADKVIEILAAEFARTLRLLGVHDAAELRTAGRELLTRSFSN
jgi:L-lactate dehydrogenase (cytochrome)